MGILRIYSRNFVKQRMVDLELWLRNLITFNTRDSNHPDEKLGLQTHSAFRHFLTSEANIFQDPRLKALLHPYESLDLIVTTDRDVSTSRKFTEICSNPHSMQPRRVGSHSQLRQSCSDTFHPQISLSGKSSASSLLNEYGEDSNPQSVKEQTVIDTAVDNSFGAIDKDDDDEDIRTATGTDIRDSSNELHEHHGKPTLDDFLPLQVIGQGAFGRVLVVRRRICGRVFAMKVMNKADIIRKGQVEHILTERRVLTRISHPFIVRLHYAFQTPARLYLVLDFAGGGELFFHLSRMRMFSERMVQFYSAEIALALQALHNIGVAYRDLKPENVLLDSLGHVLLADFGLAKEGVEKVHEGSNSLCGTPHYLPPEVLSRQGHGTAVDWWNLGMVCFEMLTGLPPWFSEDKDRQRLHRQLRTAALMYPRYVSPTAKQFIEDLLQVDPKSRLGSEGWTEISSHAFFAGVDWEALLRREVKPPFNPCRFQLCQTLSVPCDERDETADGGVGTVAADTRVKSSAEISVDTRNFDKVFTCQPVGSVLENAGEAENHFLNRLGDADRMFEDYAFKGEPFTV